MRFIWSYPQSSGWGYGSLRPWRCTWSSSCLRRCPFFWQSAAVSLARIFLGILWGTALGVLLAVLTSLSAWADRILSPIIRIIRATPVISFILLVWLWVSRVQVPTVISGLMVMPVVWGNVAKGILQTDPLLLEMARAYRFSRWNTLRLVYIPSVRPYFVSGLDTAMAVSYTHLTLPTSAYV